MARIDIERKQGPPILPIVLGVIALLVVAGVIWWVTSNGDDFADGTPAAEQPYAEPAPTGPAATADVPQEVQTYRQQCGQPGQFQDQMGLDHEHEAGCMRQLADGIDAVIRRDQVADQPLDERLRSFRQRADQITADPQATDHANRVRAAADEAAEIIDYMAQRRDAVGANLQQHAQQTRQAAGNIDPATPLLEQRERTASFFASAGDALEAMARSRANQPGAPQGQARPN